MIAMRLGRWQSARPTPYAGERKESVMAGEVHQNAAHDRFDLDVDGHTARLFYRLDDGVIAFTHTEVPDALSGQGVGSRLVRGALEAARAQNLRVVALCPFVAAYIGKHPDLLA